MHREGDEGGDNERIVGTVRDRGSVSDNVRETVGHMISCGVRVSGVDGVGGGGVVTCVNVSDEVDGVVT